MSEQAGAPAAAPSAPATQAGASPVISQGGQADAAPRTQEAKPDAKPAAAARTWDLKVNGKTQKFTEEELVSRASQAEAAQQRFTEAAQMKRQTEALIGKLKDPKGVIAALQDPALGLTRDQIRETFEEWYAKEFIEPESLSPEQKKLREAEEKIRKYDEAEKAREQQKIKDQQEATTAQAREQIQGQIIEALEQSGLPKTNFTIRRLAYWMQRNHANGFDAPTSVLVSQVRNEFNTSMRDMVEASDGETLINLLGENVIQKLRKFDLEQLRKLRGGGGQQQTESMTPTQDSGEPMTSSDVTQRLREFQRTGRY